MNTAAKMEASDIEEVDDDLLRAVVSSATLQEVRLVSSSFDIKPEYFADEDQNLSLSFDGQMASVQYKQGVGIAAGSFLWSAYVKKGNKQLCKVKSQYMVVYTVNENSDDGAVHKFIKSIGRFAIFPYFRALVAQYSAASSANLPVLPVLKQQY